MKKAIIYSLAAVLILCAGIVVGMNANKQKNTSEITSTQEAAPEEIEQNGEKVQDDTETVELSSAQPQQKQIEYFTAEDKEWIFQETYDNTQQMINSQGGSDAQCFEAELTDLPIYADYYKNLFNGRISPGTDTLREEYKTWRIEKYGDGTVNKAEPSKPAETTQQKPSSTQTQQKPSSNQNQSSSNNSGNSSSSLGDLWTPGDPNHHDPDTYEGMTPEEREAAIERDIQATKEASEISIRNGTRFS